MKWEARSSDSGLSVSKETSELTSKTDEHVVEHSQRPSKTDGIVREDVTQGGNFAGKRNVTAEVLSKERSKGSPSNPVSERMEQQLRTTPGILLPSVDFVITGKGDTLFKLVVRVGSPSDDVAFQLKSKGDGEVFRHVRFGPDFSYSVLFEDDLLQSRPSKECVVTDERTHGTVCATERDSQLDTSGEMGDTVLEKVVRDLHDTGRMLNNGDIGALFELADSVNQAVFRNSSVRIDDKNDSTAVSGTKRDEQMYLRVQGQAKHSHSDVSIRPSQTLGFGNTLTEGSLVQRLLIFIAPEVVLSHSFLCVRSHFVQNLFYSQGELNGKVHVGSLLKSTPSLETVDAVSGTGDVCHVVVVVKPLPSINFFRADELQAVIADQDRDGSTLSLVSRLCHLEGLDSGHNDIL